VVGESALTHIQNYPIKPHWSPRVVIMRSKIHDLNNSDCLLFACPSFTILSGKIEINQAYSTPLRVNIFTLSFKTSMGSVKMPRIFWSTKYNIILNFRTRKIRLSRSSPGLNLYVRIICKYFCLCDQKIHPLFCSDMEWLQIAMETLRIRQYNRCTVRRWTVEAGCRSVQQVKFTVLRKNLTWFFSADENFGASLPVHFVVQENGNVLYAPPVIIRASCRIDVTWFPFDQQHCHLKVALLLISRVAVIAAYFPKTIRKYPNLAPGEGNGDLIYRIVSNKSPGLTSFNWLLGRSFFL
jgi:hypothetical protein